MRTKQAAVNVERDQSCVKDEGRKSSIPEAADPGRGDGRRERDKRSRRVRHAENVTGRKSNKKSSNRVGDMREMLVRLKILQANEKKR
jgi:hypothetical protein